MVMQQAGQDRSPKEEGPRRLMALQKELLHKSHSGDLEGLQASVVEGTRKLLACQACALALVDQGNEEWRIFRKYTSAIGQINEESSQPAEWSYHASQNSTQSLIQECLYSGKTLNLDNAVSDKRYEPKIDGVKGVEIQSMVCLPLLVKGEKVGVLQAVNRIQGGTIRAFSRAEQNTLEMIAGLAASALNLLRMDEQLIVAKADLEASRWELMIAENALKSLFDNLPDAIYLVDRQYQLIAINRQRKSRLPERFEQTFDRQLCYQTLFGRNTPCQGCQVIETFNSGQATMRVERRFGNRTTQPGNLQENQIEDTWTEDAVEWEIHTIPVLDRDQQTLQVILLEKDITEKRQLENILTQSEKLAALGQLAAGIAHEINNPLTAIIANAQILHRSLPVNDDLQESVDLISRAGARAVQVVRNFLDFARKEEYHLSVTNLNDNLHRALELVQHELLARGIELEFSPDPDLPSILASQDHLQSVWLNLLLNAIDSLDKVPATIQVTTRKTSSHIIICVTDNGKGIPIERLGRIFEPFFTTKAPGRGTGLGLSVSYRIIQQHGGSIQVASQVGKGSKFTVTLPLS